MSSAKKKPIRIVNDAWDGYREAVIPEHAPEVQIVECKKAFFAGAITVINQLFEIGQDMPEEEGIEILDAISTEVKEFMEQID